MNKISFKGTVKFTPKYAKCDPIIIRGYWTWDEEKSRWFCDNAQPHCYDRIPLADESCERIETEREEK